MQNLLFFADSVKLDGKDTFEKPRLRDVEKAKEIQIVNKHHAILIMQDDKIASIAIMKGCEYRNSFMAVFLYEFGAGNIEISEQGKIVDKKERLGKEAFMEKLREEGVPYITL
jgi:hypothetical protein